jgi:hypothetical protein
MDIGQSLMDVLGRIIGFIPNLVAFLVLLVIGYVVAKVVAWAVRKVLEKVGTDRRVRDSDAGRYVDTVLGGASPSRGVARVVFWLIFVFFLVAAISALSIPALTSFMNRVVAYLPNIIAAVLIFAVAALVAGLVKAAVSRWFGESPTARIAGSVLPALVMVIAVFMILQQLRIAEQIVQIAFAATMGALGLGLALAFGLGGRSVAQRMLEDAYGKSRQEEFGRGREREHVRVGAQRTPPEGGIPRPSPGAEPPRPSPGGEPPRGPERP